MTADEVLAALAVLGKRTAAHAARDARWEPMLQALRAAYCRITSGADQPRAVLTDLARRFGGALGGAVGNLIDALADLERDGSHGRVDEFLRRLGAEVKR